MLRHFRKYLISANPCDNCNPNQGPVLFSVAGESLAVVDLVPAVVTADATSSVATAMETVEESVRTVMFLR